MGQDAGREVTPGRYQFCRSFLIQEARAAIRSDLGFEFFDFEGDDFIFNFVVHCFAFR